MIGYLLEAVDDLRHRLRRPACPRKPDRFAKQLPVGTVLVFAKEFPGHPRSYTYAALRVSTGDWYLTGAKVRQPAMNWQVLTMFIGDNPCAMATNWMDV